MGKKKSRDWSPQFDQDSIEFSQGGFMLKLLATIDHRKWPHVTMIACQGAKNPNEFVWGQFTQGTSKKNVLKNPKQGVFIMTATLSLPLRFIRAKIKFTHFMDEGEDVEKFSRIPLLKYNTYINVFKAFYNEVLAATPIANLSLFKIGRGIFRNLIGKSAARDGNAEKKLTPWAMEFINNPISFKFLSYIDPSDGYPVITPCMQMCAPDSGKLMFPLSDFKDELKNIPENAPVAVMLSNLEAVGHHINGTFKGFKKFRGYTFGIIEIDEIYNCMPPVAGIIYPKIQKLPKVTEFSL